MRALSLLSLVPLFFSLSCRRTQGEKPPARKPTDLMEARRGFRTRLIKKVKTGFTAPAPPAATGLALVKYQSPLGPMAAYVTKDPGDGKKHPAILWAFGTFQNSISEAAWSTVQGVDMSAAPFREAGVVMMYASTRGGNKNPGHVECLYGELDDLLAAANHLASLPFVDKKRIFFGGHSTGGTMALLMAAATQRFRAVLSLGPAARTELYGQKSLTFDVTHKKEARLRSPIHWLKGIKTPTYVFEGERQPTNLDVLEILKGKAGRAPVAFYSVPGRDHYSLIAPVARAFAGAVLEDSGAGTFAIQKKHLAGFKKR